MVNTSNEPVRPWETTPLPDADIVFSCPGQGWHDESFFPSDLLTWMQGRAGTKYPEDGFYCSQCLWAATEGWRALRPKPATGPTLLEELERRGLEEVDTLEEVNQ